VNVAGQAGPLIQHGSEASLEHPLPRPAEGALGAFPFRNVHDYADEFVGLAGLVEHRLAADMQITERAIRPDDPDIHLIAAPPA
jgi:hypothetical protein